MPGQGNIARPPLPATLFSGHAHGSPAGSIHRPHRRPARATAWVNAGDICGPRTAQVWTPIGPGNGPEPPARPPFTAAARPPPCAPAAGRGDEGGGEGRCSSRPTSDQGAAIAHAHAPPGPGDRRTAHVADTSRADRAMPGPKPRPVRPQKQPDRIVGSGHPPSCAQHDAQKSAREMKALAPARWASKGGGGLAPQGDPAQRRGPLVAHGRATPPAGRRGSARA